MEKGRLEAFSDGVMAIIITIMVLELKLPHGEHSGGLAELASLKSIFCSYVLSYVYVGIYWNNHHHLLKTVERVSGGIMWGNLHLLFWLSLVPFATAWLGENHFAPVPTALYGGILLCAAVAYFILQGAIGAAHGRDALVRRALGSDFKGKASMGLYLAAIGLAFVNVWLAQALYVAVAVWWLVPDRRIERVLNEAQENGGSVA